MKKLLIMVMFLSAYLGASSISYPGLFADVVNVAKNDTLNVRAKPDYHSEKVGELPADAMVGIDYCKKIGQSLWCKVFSMSMLDFGTPLDEVKSNWVNAGFLEFDNSTYVSIDGKEECYYSLKCQGNRCKVILGTIYDSKTDYVKSLKIDWIARERLKVGNNAIGVTGCETDRVAEEFFQIQKVIKHLGQESKKAFEVLSILRNLDDVGSDSLANYIHPKKGVVMTWHVLFGGKEDLTFTQSDIKNLEKNRSKKNHWGYTYGRGDEVRMSLYDYIQQLTKPLKYFKISKVKRVRNLKGFHCPTRSQCKGYEIFWIDENSKTPEYDWQGLVMVLEKYQGTWYVVGLLRDRWTI